MHLYSLCQTWLTLKTHAVSETENRTSCLTTVSQTMTVSSCQSDISNQCRIKKCSTEKSIRPLATWKRRGDLIKKTDKCKPEVSLRGGGGTEEKRFVTPTKTSAHGDAVEQWLAVGGVDALCSFS